MEKTYCVSVDITVAKNIYVEAESEGQAMDIATSMVDEDPDVYARRYSHVVGFEIVDAVEED